jgi:hypothetical protein
MSNMPGNSDNPYAVYNTHAPAPAQQTGGIFQKGKLLIVHKQAVLPDLCIKSNEPTSERLKRKLMWHHPAVYLVILFNLLVYVIVSLIVRKTATFNIPLAARYKAARVRWMIIAWSMAFLSIALFIVGLATIDSPSATALSALCLIQFPFALITSILIGIFGCRVIYAKKIDDQYAWIGGTCEEFRRMFPEWPYPG